MEGTYDALHSIAKKPMKANPVVTNNNAAGVTVSAEDMSKSQISGTATTKFRDAIMQGTSGSDSGNLMAKK